MLVASPYNPSLDISLPPIPSEEGKVKECTKLISIFRAMQWSVLGGGGATSPNFTPDVWAQIGGKWVLCEPQVARLAYSYMGEF